MFLDVIMGFDEQQLLVQLSQGISLTAKVLFCVIIHMLMQRFIVSDLMLSIAKYSVISARHVRASARRASARSRVVHRPPLTGFTSGVHRVHPLSQLRSSSIPNTKLNN